MNLRKKCTKVTSLILAVAVGLLLTGAIFHQTFCTEGAPTLTSLGGDAVENQEPPIEEIKREKKKIRKRRINGRENIRSQQSKIKQKLIKIDETLERKLDQIRRLKHHDRATATTGASTKSD